MFFSKKLHYYVCSFAGTERGTITSVVLRYPTEGFTQPRQIQARRNAGLPDDASIFCVSYLGKMSRKYYETTM